MARPAGPPTAPLTPARALRLALQRGAERSVGLALVGLGVAEEEGPLDDLLLRLEGGLMLHALMGAGGDALGLMALDAEAVAAAVEAQTLGRPSPRPADPREATAADAALALPLLDAVLHELAASDALDGLGPVRLGPRVPGPREAAMALPDGAFRALRLTVDIGVAGRQGLLVLLLRRPAPPPAALPTGPTLAEQVLGAEAAATAVLARLRLGLSDVEGLEVGAVLALPGVTVASVRIEAAGLDLGPARLGQVAGRRALRIEEPLAPRLAEIGLPDAGIAGAIPALPS